MDPVMSAMTPGFFPSESCSPSEWFAIYVMTRHEKRISEHLRIRQIESFPSTLFGAATVEGWIKVTVQLPLFPNYLFVRTLRNQRGRVLEVPGVLSAVGKRESSVISDIYIDSLRQAISSGKVEPHPYLATGALVRVRSGILAGLQGIVLRQKSNCRVVLSLELIMRSVAVEVNLADL